MKLFLTFLIVISLVGCDAEFVNVSKDERYATILGSKYQTLTELRAHGIPLAGKNRKVVGQYVVTTLPGGSGREVISKINLHKGTIIRIKKIVRCVNCLPPKTNFMIETDNNQLNHNFPIRLYNYSIENNTSNVMMNPLLFFKIKE